MKFEAGLKVIWSKCSDLLELGLVDHVVTVAVKMHQCIRWGEDLVFLLKAQRQRNEQQRHPECVLIKAAFQAVVLDHTCVNEGRARWKND